MSDFITVGVDASNIGSGGGIRHLVEILDKASPEKNRIKKVILWVPSSLRPLYPSKDWLDVREVRWFEKSLIHRFLWRLLFLRKAVRKECDVVFCPGGLSVNAGCPEVVMSQNMQPFIASERKAVGFGRSRLRLELLRFLQGRSLQRASRALFLAEFARDAICEQFSFEQGKARIIPHGVDASFFSEIDCFIGNKKTQVLYVSTLDVYKHQNEVVDAASLLADEGVDFQLVLVGGKTEGYGDKVIKRIEIINDYHRKEIVKYLGKVDFQDLPKIYSESDVFVFASSCENLPNILLEAMASGLPIISSEFEPMPSVLGDAGIYCDVECSKSIAESIKKYIFSEEMRHEMSKRAQNRARLYSWELASDKTFELLFEASGKS